MQPESAHDEEELDAHGTEGQDPPEGNCEGGVSVPHLLRYMPAGTQNVIYENEKETTPNDQYVHVRTSLHLLWLLSNLDATAFLLFLVRPTARTIQRAGDLSRRKKSFNKIRSKATQRQLVQKLS